jgi:hypothetical protein
MTSKPEEKRESTARELLRHCIATLAYRGGKAIRSAPEGFADFKTAEKTRTPGQILAHLSDLMDWALSMAKGKQEWHDTPPKSWDEGAKRFFAALQSFDAYLASDAPLDASAERLLQGPVADAFTHVGQIAMLRGMAGASIRPENYFKADITIGRVGAEQTPPKREF